VINRFVQTVQTSAHPVLPFDDWQIYIANWAEWSTTLMILAYGALLLSLSYRYLPIFPKEKQLNS
jgi:molybdopterin-containing oxidoreductase family membrane subunit